MSGAGMERQAGSRTRLEEEMEKRPAEKLLFLPGASGNTDFWRPVADLLRVPGERVFLGWPGFGPTPADPGIASLEDLVGTVLERLDVPCALLAQSMGGVIALQCALR